MQKQSAIEPRDLPANSLGCLSAFAWLLLHLVAPTIFLKVRYTIRAVVAPGRRQTTKKQKETVKDKLDHTAGD